MNTKKKFIAIFIFFSVLTLSIFNIKNPEKTKFYYFTSNKEISLGNLITITFISGFTFSTLLTLVSKNNLKQSIVDDFINDEEIEKSDESYISKELEVDRPPERDVRESQPTISVNYRYVDQDSNSYSSQNSRNNLYNENNDWKNSENEW